MYLSICFEEILLVLHKLLSIISFPVSEALLCYFASFLACQQLSPQRINTYLAGVRHMQICWAFQTQGNFLIAPPKASAVQHSVYPPCKGHYSSMGPAAYYTGNSINEICVEPISSFSRCIHVVGSSNILVKLLYPRPHPLTHLSI